MKALSILNKGLGALLLTLLSIPLIVLIGVSRLFNFIDLLYAGKINDALFSLISSPLMALLTMSIGITSFLNDGWKIGLMNLITTLPKRLTYFFTKQLFFGAKDDESINDFFPSEIKEIITSGFFGQLTLKLLSLCFSMETGLSHHAKIASPHNDVNIYCTEQNLTILKKKYEGVELSTSEEISNEINAYLSSKHEKFTKEEEELLSDNKATTGKLQSAQDNLATVKAAQRCINNFMVDNRTAFDLKFQCTPTTVLHYIWLAINTECSGDQNEDLREGLKETLMRTLFQIQRGFNIATDDEDANSTDLPECPSGAIGLLVRVICDGRIPGSLYEALDPSPANLAYALKRRLDAPFTNTSDAPGVKAIKTEYEKNPAAYKKDQQELILKDWKRTYGTLFTAKNINFNENNMEALIEAGVEAWEPPDDAENTPAYRK